MRSRNDNNAAVLGSAGGLEERVHANTYATRSLRWNTLCNARYFIALFIVKVFNHILR